MRARALARVCVPFSIYTWPLLPLLDGGNFAVRIMKSEHLRLNFRRKYLQIPIEMPMFTSKFLLNITSIVLTACRYTIYSMLCYVRTAYLDGSRIDRVATKVQSSLTILT